MIALALFIVAVAALGFSLYVRDKYKADPAPRGDFTAIRHNEWLRSKRIILDSAMRRTT